jgi:hypothetical protein
MNKEQRELLDDAWANYKKNSQDDYDIWNKSTFINKIKTDSEFSEKWGLTIEERELSGEERFKLWQNEQDGRTAFIPELLDSVPTKQITITYNDKTIESYE